jgi:hypothetical protein
MDKPYTRPQLVIYGDIRQITQAVANNSMVTDGGEMSTQKTF